MSFLDKQDWTKENLLRYIGHMDQVAGIKLVEDADGKGRGSRILQVWTGTGLYFHVLADRGLDISTCRYKGNSLAWNSSVGEVHPAHYEPRGLGWLRSFQGGLFVTCGLDQYGFPAVDGDEELGLHGRASNLPARFVNHRAQWVDGKYELEISGETRQTKVHGENLALRRRISTHMGSSKIVIEDEVTNEGFAPHPHMILYHFNLGFPLLSEASELDLRAEQTIARDAEAETGLAEWQDLQPPTSGYREQVFRHVPVADGEGRVRVEVKNPVLGLGLRLTYDKQQLPYLFQWKMMGEGMYVLGIEPGNCGTLGGRVQARAEDENGLVYLAPGESRRYKIGVEVVETS